jgi:tRNA pseudouridine38-40 synthase
LRLRIDLAYDGGPYAGYARQPGQVTVQGVLEDALASLLGQPATTFVAGRTDRGVHADAQVIHLDVEAGGTGAVGVAEPLDPERLAAFAGELDAATPPSIVINAVRRVPATFHARFSATSRTYRFRLRDGVDPRAPHEGPHEGGRGGDVWVVRGTLDVPAMRAAARHLVGEHDFAAFCRRRPEMTTMRRVHAIALRRVAREGDGRIDVRVHGSAFCHQQVRSIVGCLVDVGRGRRPPEWVGAVLTSRDRSLAAPVAPPQGLTLERVTFGPGHPAAPPPGARTGLARAAPAAG